MRIFGRVQFKPTLLPSVDGEGSTANYEAVCAEQHYSSKSPTVLQKGLWTLLCYAGCSLPIVLRVDSRPPLPGGLWQSSIILISAPLAGFIWKAVRQTMLEISPICQAVPLCSHAETEIISTLVKVIKSLQKENMKLGKRGRGGVWLKKV